MDPWLTNNSSLNGNNTKGYVTCRQLSHNEAIKYGVTTAGVVGTFHFINMRRPNSWWRGISFTPRLMLATMLPLGFGWFGAQKSFIWCSVSQTLDAHHVPKEGDQLPPSYR